MTNALCFPWWARRLCVVLAVLACAMTSNSAKGQTIAPKPAGPGTLIGMVTDTLGQPLADVSVELASVKRRTRTNADGGFRFDSLKAGTYEVATRKLGYVAEIYGVVVRPEGGSLYIKMIRLATYLPSMVSKAERGGLSGIIGDTAYRPVGGVKVKILGSSFATESDSTGAFFVALTPGQYMVVLERDGFARQRVGVSIPENEGRKIAAWMVPAVGRDNPLEGANLFDLNQRVMRVSPATSKFLTREDMQKQGLDELQQVARLYAGKFPQPDCMVTINGGPRTVPLWQLSASDLEFVEVYLPSNVGGAGTRGVTSLSGLATTLTTSTSVRPPISPACGVGLIAWLR
jgi:hypothetical protein